MQYQLLASDFDNTLVPFGEPCPRPAVVRAVKKMQAAGGKFVLSTGRGYCVINKQQLGGIRFDYAITNNGACVVDRDGAIIAEHPMTNEEMYALVDFCEDYNYPLQFNFRDGYYAYCEYESLRDFYAQLSGSGLTCKDGEDQDRHLIDMPHAAFACLPDEALEAFNRKYGHLNLRFMLVGAVREGSWHCYDIVREGIDKGVGLADLCETVGLTLADAVSAGDSANDVGMLKAAGLGCCMANGSDDAKEAADRIIGDVREDGLAALIEELWFNGPRAEPDGSRGGKAVSFAPVYNEHSRALILGTWPSPKSREMSFYYGHPQNRFWPMLAALTGEPVPAREDIEAKKQIILRHGLALWDTLESCTITGASDASIRDVVPNDIAGLLAKAPIEAVFCNGATAYKIYTKYLEPVSGIPAVRLPSTSPANAACRPEKLREIWQKELSNWILP